VLPIPEYFPLGQGIHADAAIDLPVYVPAGHMAQETVPPDEYILLYVPDRHGEQLV